MPYTNKHEEYNNKHENHAMEVSGCRSYGDMSPTFCLIIWSQLSKTR